MINYKDYYIEQKQYYLKNNLLIKGDANDSELDNLRPGKRLEYFENQFKNLKNTDELTTTLQNLMKKYPEYLMYILESLDDEKFSKNKKREILLERIKENASEVFKNDKVNKSLYNKLPNDFRKVNLKNWDLIYQYFNKEKMIFEFFESEYDEFVESGFKNLISFFEKYVNKKNHKIILNTTNIEEISSVNNYYGIEIEGCYYDNNENIDLEIFKITKDDSVECWKGTNNVEYVLKDKTTLQDLKGNLANDINKIKESFKYTREMRTINDKIKIIKQYCFKYCGIHFHFSNKNIKLDLYGLLFLIYFFKEWLDGYQDEFIKEYEYECRIYPHTRSYNNRNILNDEEKNILITLKDEIMNKIKKKEFNDSIFIALVFTKLKLLLKNAERSRSTPNYLWIVDDLEFIHFEFRGFINSEKNLNNIIPILEKINEISEFTLKKIKIELELEKLTNEIQSTNEI